MFLNVEIDNTGVSFMFIFIGCHKYAQGICKESDN